MLDSNAFGLEILSNRAVMTDAGGNSLLQVDTNLHHLHPRGVPAAQRDWAWRRHRPNGGRADLDCPGNGRQPVCG